MNASKENARKALECLDRAKDGSCDESDLDFLTEFVQATERKLPTEAAYDRDKGRKTA